jgi:hypothetical protein
MSGFTFSRSHEGGTNMSSWQNCVPFTFHSSLVTQSLVSLLLCVSPTGAQPVNPYGPVGEVVDLVPDIVRTDMYEGCRGDERIYRKDWCIGTYVRVDHPIPRLRYKSNQPYESWSLFLVCNPTWLLETRGKMRKELHESFRILGPAIGSKHLAVWFWDRNPGLQGRDVPWPIDTRRSAEFCKKFGLLPSESPHVLVTTAYPDLQGPVGNFVVVRFNGARSEDMAQLVTKLADQLLVQGLDQVALDSTSYWQKWRRGLESVLTTLGEWVKEVRVQVKAGPIEVEIKGGK